MSAVASSSTPAGSVETGSTIPESAAAAALEKEKVAPIAHLIRFYGVASPLNADDGANYVIENLASNPLLAAAVQSLMDEMPSDPVAHLIAMLGENGKTEPETPLSDNDCTVRNINALGLPAPLPLPASNQSVKSNHPRRWTTSTEVQDNTAKVEHGTSSDVSTATAGRDDTEVTAVSGLQFAVEGDDDAPTLPMTSAGDNEDALVGGQRVPVQATASVVREDTEKLLESVITKCSKLNEASKKKHLDKQLRNKVIDGRFEIIRSLGVGGLGAVFQCRDLFMPRQVAVKVDLQLNSNISEYQKKVVERDFLREGAIVAMLDSPYIMKIFHFGRTPSKMLYQIMEYIPGKTLKDFLKVHHRMEKIRTVSVVGGVLEGLHHAHQKGVVHKDLKPANILLLDGNRGAKIIDWGTAQCRLEADHDDHGEKVADNKQHVDVEVSVAAVGTPKYMSIEQLQKLLNRDIQLDGRSDLYAVGLIAYECLTGLILRDHYSFFEAWQKAVNEFFDPENADDAELVRTRRENLSSQIDLLKDWQFPDNNSLGEAFCMFLRQALQPDAKDRFPRAKEMLWALEHMDESAQLPQAIQDAFENVKNGRDLHATLDVSAQPPMAAAAVRRLLSYMIDYEYIQRLTFAKEQALSYEHLTNETRLQVEQLFHLPRHLWIENLFHLELILEVIKKGDYLLAQQMIYLSHRAETNQDMVTILLCLMSLVPESSNAEREVLQRYLLAQGADIRDNDGFTAFHRAVTTGNVQAMNALLDAGADIHAPDSQGSTQLLLACDTKAEDVTVLSLLLKRGAESHINSKNKEGRLPLHAALRQKNQPLVALLLKHGANFTGAPVTAPEATALLSLECFEFNPLSRKYETEVVSVLMSFLIDSGVVEDINGISLNTNYNGATVLHVAASRSQHVVRWLLLHGADLDARDSSGQSALFHACGARHKSVPIISVLLEFGAARHIHIRTNTGKLPLHRAWNARRKDVVALLLKHGANFTGAPVAAHESSPLLGDSGAEQLSLLANDLIESCNFDRWKFSSDTNNWPALLLAARRGHKDAVQWLLDDGADSFLTDKNNKGLTSLHRAAIDHCVELVSLLLDNGADIHALNKEDESVLLAACKSTAEAAETLAVVSVLLERGAKADIHQRDNTRRLPLHEALQQKNQPLVALLLKHGANFTGAPVTAHESSPLLGDSGAEELSLLANDLIECGVVDDIDKLGEDGLTALHKAVSRAHKAVVQWLLDDGADVNLVVGQDSSVPHRNALDLACESENVDFSLVELLLLRGVTVGESAIVQSVLAQRPQRPWWKIW